MNAITSVSKQTNTMVTKMLTWLKNKFQTSGWHHCGCLSVIHNLWLYTQGCWHRNHLTEKYFHLNLTQWMETTDSQNWTTLRLIFLYFLKKCFLNSVVSKTFLCIHSYVKVLLISHLFTVCSSKKELIGSDGKHSADSFSERVFFSIRNG